MAAREALAAGAEDRLRQVLTRMLARSRDIRFICVGSVDGRAVSCVPETAQREAPRYAAMSSSLLALNETLVKEALASTAHYSLVAAPHGAVVTVRVPSASKRFALSLAADSASSVAITLRNALDSAEAVAQVLP